MKPDTAWQVSVIERFGHCERCRTTEGLCGHHFIPRRYRGARYDIRNGVSVCPKCHQYLHSNPIKNDMFCRIVLVERGDFQSLDALQDWRRRVLHNKSREIV